MSDYQFYAIWLPSRAVNVPLLLTCQVWKLLCFLSLFHFPVWIHSEWIKNASNAYRREIRKLINTISRSFNTFLSHGIKLLRRKLIYSSLEIEIKNLLCFHHDSRRLLHHSFEIRRRENFGIARWLSLAWNQKSFTTHAEIEIHSFSLSCNQQISEIFNKSFLQLNEIKFSCSNKRRP